MSPDGVAGAPGVFGNGLTSSSVRGWRGFEEYGDSAEGGEGGWSVGSIGSHIFVGNTTRRIAGTVTSNPHHQI